jgi:hypothetical protein
VEPGEDLRPSLVGADDETLDVVDSRCTGFCPPAAVSSPRLPWSSRRTSSLSWRRAFTEQEIVILAALAAEINRNARLFEALGAPPPDFGAQTT